MGKKLENGNVAEIVIIIVLLLVVIGLVVWRVVDSGKNTSVNNGSVNTIAPTDDYYSIQEWGVKIKLQDVSKKITIGVDNTAGSYAGMFDYDGVATPDFKPEYVSDTSCTPGLSLYRSAKSQSDDGTWKKIGAYYYTITGGPASCPGNEAADKVKGQFVARFSLQNLEAE